VLGKALEALEIKYRIIKQRTKENLLPFLTQKTDGDQYFRIENAVRLVSFVGLNEAVHAFFGKPLKQEGETLEFAKKIVSHIQGAVSKYSKRPETRAALAMIPAPDAAKRLAALDAERYGWAKVRAQGTRENPFYTDQVAMPLTQTLAWKDRLRVEGQFHSLTPGGHLAVIPLDDEELEPESLLSITKDVAGNSEIGCYFFNRKITYCSSCQKVFYGKLTRCPDCGSVSMLQPFSHI